MKYRSFIEHALKEAAAIAVTSFGKVSGTVKPEDNNQVLTETDIEIGKLLVDRVGREYPSHNIIDEEAGVIDKGSDYTWVIDPIDGTSNFASGIPTYGVMIGLLKAETPIAGGIALPSFDEILIGEKGHGTYKNGHLLKVSDVTTLLSALVAYGIDGHQEDVEFTRKETTLLGEIILNIRNLRSSNSAFDAAMVAQGKYGAYLNRTSKIWDNVAQQVIIEEAGGVYTDFYGNPIDYSDALNKVDENYTWCAGAPALHQQLQAIIHK